MLRASFSGSRTLCLAVAGLIGIAACQKQPEAPEAPPPAAPRPAAQTSLPPRAEGLWAMTITEEGSVEPPQQIDICINAEVDKHLGLLGNDLSGDTCTRTVSPTAADSWGILAECQMGSGVKNEFSGSATGDFSTAYSLKLRLQTTGSELPQMNRVTNYTVDAKLVGLCDHGVVPGDVTVDGFKFNLFDMAGMSRSSAASEVIMHDD